MIDIDAVRAMNVEQARAALVLMLLMSEPSMTLDDAVQQIEEVTDTENAEQVQARVFSILQE